MNHNPRLEEAARRVLEGDESIAAARSLEEVVVNDYPGDERLDELVYLLSLYSPGVGQPYCDAQDLRTAVRRALADLEDSADGG